MLNKKRGCPFETASFLFNKYYKYFLEFPNNKIPSFI